MKSKTTQGLLSDQSSKRYYILLATVLGLTVLAPLVEHVQYGRMLVGVFAILSLVAAVMAANASKATTIFAIVLAIFTCGIWGLSLSSGVYSLYPISLQSGAYFLTLIFVAAIGLMMLKEIFSNEVTGNRVAGAICVYLLMGFFFAITHMTVLLFDPHAYKDSSGDRIDSSTGALAAQTVYPLFVYYSFCTLSTAGYGDILPLSHTARTMSWLEAVGGQIYLTVLVARLVGLHIASATAAGAVATSSKSALIGATDETDDLNKPN